MTTATQTAEATLDLPELKPSPRDKLREIPEQPQDQRQPDPPREEQEESRPLRLVRPTIKQLREQRAFLHLWIAATARAGMVQVEEQLMEAAAAIRAAEVLLLAAE